MTEVTDAAGTYLFAGVATGEYAVRVIQPPNGTQTFPEGVDNRPEPTTLDTDTEPNSLVAGDFNRDGHLDLAVVNAGTTSISVFLNDTSGSFLAAAAVDVGTAPLSIQAIQFNDDNSDLKIDDNDYIDLVVGYSATNFISILFNDQSGGFIRSDATANLPYAPWYTAPGDFDQDGDVDIITVHLNNNSVSYMERFSGTFVSPAPTIATGQFPASLITAQLNDDDTSSTVDENDFLDVVWVDILPGADTVTALFNDGAMVAPTTVSKNVGGRPFAVAAGDFDGDGFNDLAVTVPEDNQVAILTNTQSSNFSLPVFVSAGLGPSAITAGDLDNDGDVDLAITNASDEGFTILRNDGTGTFTPETSGAAAFTNPLAVGIIAAQLNNDSTLDLAIANGLGDESVLFLANRLIDRAQRVTVLNGASVTADFGTQLPNDMLGDMNGDGLVNLGDVALFIEALTNRAAYDARGFSVDADQNGDVDDSGTYDLGDISAFSGLFGGPASASATANASGALSASTPVAAQGLSTGSAVPFHEAR